MFDLRTDVLFWGQRMSTTVKSAVHFCREHKHNMIECRNENFEEIKTARYHIKAECGNSFEILNLSGMIYDFSLWIKSTVCHDRAIKWRESKGVCLLIFSLVSDSQFQ